MDIGKARTLLDFVLACIGIGAHYAILHLTTTRRGFFCDDDSIRYTFHRETVSWHVEKLLVFFTGFILIILTEFIKGRSAPTTRRINLSGFVVKEWISFAYTTFVGYILTAIYFNLFIDILKIKTGSLRPSFIEKCQPNIDLRDCSRYHHKYITDYICEKRDDPFNRHSFPSGHAALAGFVTVFSVLYIHFKWITNDSSPFRFLKHLVMGLVILGYGLLALSRYSDNAHHPIDIAVGYALGTFVGYYTARHVCGVTVEEVKPEEEQSLLIPSTSQVQPHSKSKPGVYL